MIIKNDTENIFILLPRILMVRYRIKAKDSIIIGAKATGKNTIDIIVNMIGETNNPVLVVIKRSNLSIAIENRSRIDDINIIEIG
jgi:hypothetical protein